MLEHGWRGYLIAWFALVWIANVYIGLFNRIRIEIKREKTEIDIEQNRIGPSRTGPEQ